jgi:hypothetical protein
MIQKFNAFYIIRISLGAIKMTFESYGFLARRELYKVTGTKDEDKETDYQAASGWQSRCHGVASAKTKKSFDREEKRKRRSNDGRDRIGREKREEERKKHQQATRGSNLPGRRDFASEAEANC